MKLGTIGVLIASAIALAACGEKVEIPPAHVGKVLGKNGYHPETIPPSKFRLPWCWAYCDKLVVAQIADVGVEEDFQLFMPKDQLNMRFDIRGTFAIRNEDDSINQLYDRVLSHSNEEFEGVETWHNIILFDDVYEVYGKQVLRDVIRSTIAEYSINTVASNRDAVNAEIIAAVKKGLQHTPIKVIRLGLADVQFPDVITLAKENAADRRIKIDQAEADKQIRLVKLQADLEAARAERNIRKEKAQAILEENQIIAKSVTPDYLEYRKLEVLEYMAKNENTVFVPMEALGTLGLQQRIFAVQKVEKD
jgi:regulator of protease activity HflC (stomatin/prohibitin superfamily)